MKTKMEIILIIIVCLVVASIIFFVTQNKIPEGESGMLQIIESPWTGWSRRQPPDIIKNEMPEEGKKIILNNSGKYILTVKKTSPEEVRLTVDGLSLIEAEMIKRKITPTGLMFDCKYQDFIVRRGEKIELNTCSLDGGTKWTITYVK